MARCGIGWRAGLAALTIAAGLALASRSARAAAPIAIGPPSPLALTGGIGTALDPPAGAEAPAPLALANPYALPPEADVRIGGGTGKKSAPRTSSAPRRSSRRLPTVQLTPERAQALLRSLTVPGWGEATLGHRTAGTVFGVIEAGVWGSFAAFRIQDRLRREGAARTAQIYAGVDLAGRDEEFRRLVGAFASSDEYNQLVVMRDAANLFYDDPVKYRAYIAEHSIGGDLAWSWRDQASFLRYQAQRKDAHRAALRANTALACAMGNRILSLLHTARVASRKSAAAQSPRSWNFEVTPAGGDDPTAYRFALRTSF